MRPFYRICRLGCQVFFLLFFRGRVMGIRNVPRTGGVLLVCNHQSFLDPVLATLALPRECHYMARDTLFRGPLRPLIEALNAFPVKRATADVGAIKETLRRLKQGALITVFPEGTRTPDGHIHPMQPGVILIARKTGVPIVPTLILGAYESWPRHSPLPIPARVLIAHDQPISADELRDMSDDECIRTIRERLLAMMQRYRRHSSLAGQLKPLPSHLAPLSVAVPPVA